MRTHKLTPLCLAIGMAFAGSASAVTWDFSGTNFYMKFLDGNMRQANTGSIDTNSGADQGQFTEMNLVFKATISPKVEAGGRIQSRSSASYWTDYGGFGNEGNVNNNVNDMKFMKLRGAYVELSPGYDWLSQVRVGTSDWGMFDPFTVGKVRYIDRDNYNGLYFKGPLMNGNSWEVARISLPNYLQLGWGGPNSGSDNTQYQEAIYIAQLKVPVKRTNLTASYQSFIDHTLGTNNGYAGYTTRALTRNRVFMLKADGSVADGVDLRGAFYHSSFEIAPGLSPAWGYNSPSGNKNDGAFKLDADLNLMDNLAFNLQYFNIGAGYHSIGAARRESDVLLTEGSESAWYNWGGNPIWAGGAAADYTQSATNVYMTDNGYMDFNESPAQSVLGWKGLTALAKLDVANSPMSLEVTRVGYNSNWQGYPAGGPLAGGQFGYSTNQDRSTNIFAFKLNHVFHSMGGLDANLKLKRVDDRDRKLISNPTDDRAVHDTGVTASLGKQLSNDLYGTVSYGRYLRDITAGANAYNNSKSIYSLKFAYNLPGYEFGMLTQWILGHGNPTETVGADTKIVQYRLKAYSQVNF